MNFTQKEIDDLINPVLKLSKNQRKLLIDQFIDTYNNSIAVTEKEEHISQSLNLTPSFSNLTPEEVEEVLNDLASTSNLKNPSNPELTQEKLDIIDFVLDYD